MMGDLGTWTDFGPWSKCRKCKPYGQKVVTIKRTRKCQVDGICKDNCAGSGLADEDIKVCDNVPYCPAKYKDNSECMKTKPDENKVRLFNLQEYCLLEMYSNFIFLGPMVGQYWFRHQTLDPQMRWNDHNQQCHLDLF